MGVMEQLAGEVELEAIEHEFGASRAAALDRTSFNP